MIPFLPTMVAAASMMDIFHLHFAAPPGFFGRVFPVPTFGKAEFTISSLMLIC